MNNNEISILDWLKDKLKNPKSWFKRSLTQKISDSKTTTSLTDGTNTPASVISAFDNSPDVKTNSSDGLVQVDLSFTMPAGSSVHLTVEAKLVPSSGDAPASVSSERFPGDLRIAAYPYSGNSPQKESRSLLITLKKTFESINKKINIPLTAIFFILSLVLYLFTRFGGLQRFPAFFFSDEAMQSIYAEQLIQHNFLSANDKNIPVYVPVEGNRWSPMATMYVQAVSVLIFGKSILQTRATSIFIGFLGVISVSLILKLIFKQKYWWGAILFLTLLPAWFLHSRTAFETVMTTAFFAIFLLFYLLYRYRAPGYLFGAVFFGAMTFYSYSNGQALMGITAIGLAISDWRYHWGNRRIILWCLPLIILLMIPFIIFQIKIPNAIESHLRAINSYWYQHISTGEKISIFIKNYLTGLSPQYWFIANSRDLIRHRMIGYGHIPLWSLPLVLIGIILVVKNFHESSYRTLLIAALAAPVGGSMLEISIARTLAFIVPATLLAMLGLEWLLGWLERKIKPTIVATGLFIIFTALSLITFNDAVINGPLWTNIYGLYGLQYGAAQIFQETLPQYVKDPNIRHITISPVWANATDRFVYFFFTPEEWKNRIFVYGIDTYLFSKQDLSPQDLFVWTVDEYKKAFDSGKYESIDIEKTIPYPNGEPGFYVVRMKYAENIDEIFAAEKAARSQPIEEDITIDGQIVHVSYSRIDGGELKNIFDGDPYTLMRGLEANPMIIQLEFTVARSLTGLDLTTATMADFTVTIKLYGQDSESPVIYEQNFKDLPSDPITNFNFDKGPEKVKIMVVEIKHNTLEDPTHIHIRELKLR
jgi:hypothetical protein